MTPEDSGRDSAATHTAPGVASSVLALAPSVGGSKSGCSQMLTHRVCPKEYALAYVLGARPRETPEAFSIGTATHRALEWYQKVERLGRRDLLPQKDFIEEEIQDIKHVQIALGIAKVYKEEWARRDEDWEVTYCEDEFGISMAQLDPGGPFPELDGEIRTIKPDKVERNIRTGRWKVSDYKTEWVEYNVDGLPPWTGPSLYESSLQGMFYQLTMNLLFPQVEFEPFTIERCRKIKPYAVKEAPLRFSPCAFGNVPRQVRYYVREQCETHAMILAGVQPIQNFGACAKRHDPSGVRRWADCTYHSVCHATSLERQNEVLKKQFKAAPSQMTRAILGGLRVID